MISYKVAERVNEWPKPKIEVEVRKKKKRQSHATYVGVSNESQTPRCQPKLENK
jgi:hypothetical protein